MGLDSKTSATLTEEKMQSGSSRRSAQEDNEPPWLTITSLFLLVLVSLFFKCILLEIVKIN